MAQSLPLEANIARNALRNILEPLLEGMLLFSPVRKELTEALSALNFGETLPILKPSKKGQKRRYLELKGQLRAIGHIEFRRSSCTKEKAQREVAEVYGIDFETVKSWEHRLKKKVGKKAVARKIAAGRAAAEHGRAETDQNSYWAVVARLGYSDEVLRRDAEEYKEHLREGN
jgi:hypothetical protein